MPFRPPKSSQRRPYWVRGREPDTQPLARSADDPAVAWALSQAGARYQSLRQRGAKLPARKRFRGTLAEIMALMDVAEAELVARGSGDTEPALGSDGSV